MDQNLANSLGVDVMKGVGPPKVLIPKQSSPQGEDQYQQDTQEVCVACLVLVDHCLHCSQDSESLQRLARSVVVHHQRVQEHLSHPSPEALQGTCLMSVGDLEESPQATGLSSL